MINVSQCERWFVEFWFEEQFRTVSWQLGLTGEWSEHIFVQIKTYKALFHTTDLEDWNQEK